MNASDWDRYNANAREALAAGYDTMPYISRRDANLEVRAMVRAQKLEQDK